MQTYFEHYAQAFVAGDIDQIAEHYAYPCLIVNQAGADVIFDAGALGQHLEGFLAALGARGVDTIDVTISAHTKHSVQHATAAVAYTVKDAHGQTLEAFAYLYVLVKNRAGAWTIRLAELLAP